MSGDLHRANVEFRRKMFELLEKEINNALAQLDSELRSLKLKRSLIRHFPLPAATAIIDYHFLLPRE